MAVSCLITAWSKHEAELLNFMRHRLNNPSQAEDLLHDLFLKAWAQGDNFCSVVNARAWLFEVARNTLIDRSRRTRNEVTLPECVFHPNSATHNDRNPPPVTTPSRPPIPPAKPPPIPIKKPARSAGSEFRYKNRRSCAERCAPSPQPAHRLPLEFHPMRSAH